MNKQNCWEVKNCGRQPGGSKVDELGLCLASKDSSCDGINLGKNAGRICWAVTGTFCGGAVQGSYAQKRLSCMTCEFFMRVKEEQGAAFQLMLAGQIYQAAD